MGVVRQSSGATAVPDDQPQYFTILGIRRYGVRLTWDSKPLAGAVRRAGKLRRGDRPSPGAAEWGR